ncbi:RCC1-containing protein [Coleophoma cylindrospora]|uniref:RCC1-containing protein n=1 Tax=Coleophoma cylindrospora TaxID=1849047 RepID=A0A3D8SSR5_9HELO|nr:RCC1-containing protein [Coleophoma cylindrospora]
MTTLYAIGSNGSGQLGIGHKEDVSVPKPVLFDPTLQLKPITQIRAGGNHTLFITSTGELFSSGDPSSGARGLSSGTEISDLSVRKICLSAEADAVISRSHTCFGAATWEASIIVQKDETGRATKVYSIGIGNKGELGLGELLFRSSKAELIKDFPPGDLEVVDVAASVTHVVAVLSNGDVYGWGNGRKGQIGLPEGIIHSPRKIEGLPFKVVKAVCGREFTYLLGGSSDGRHAILGSDKWEIRSSAPQSVGGWKDAGAGWGSIVVLLDDGSLLSWGRNDHGQQRPTDMPPVAQIAIGSEHSLALTNEGDVLAWGWGEHGNCGPSTINGDVKGTWNVIASGKYLPPGSAISYIGAGCATSWVCLQTST